MIDPTRGEATIETVTGPIGFDGFTSALAHEHLFVDFLGPDHPDYCQVDWRDVRTECLERLIQVQRAGADLLVDCTGIGIGRNVDLLRAVSTSSGIRIVCATGIYKSLPTSVAGGSHPRGAGGPVRPRADHRRRGH